MIDTRPFVELNKNLTPSEQYQLQDMVIKATKVTDACFRSWRLGRRTPAPLYQDIIVKQLKKMGVITSPATLFPTK